MQKMGYGMFIPFEVGDIINYVEDNNEYELIDIQHTYSVKEKTVIDISFIIYHPNKGKLKVPYKENIFKIVRYNSSL